AVFGLFRSPSTPSYFTEPVTVNRSLATPNKCRFSAYSAVWTAKWLTKEKRHVAMRRTFCQRARLRGLIRVLITTTGTWRCDAAKRKLGHSSLSARTTRFG